MKQRLLIVGAGGHGRSVAEAVIAGSEYEVVGFLDDGYPAIESLWEMPVMGTAKEFADVKSHFDVAIIAIGNNRVREALQQRLARAGIGIATIIHPKAMVSPRAVVGSGVAVMAGAVIGTEAMLGDGVIVNSGAVVDHHCKVEEFGHLGVNASMAGGSVVGRGAWMQAGSTIGYKVRIENYAVLQPGQGLAMKTD